MNTSYPEFNFHASDISDDAARFVILDNPKSYPFDQYHSHQYNEIIYFRKGGGIHSINFKEFQIEDHSIHILRNGDLHWMERTSCSQGWAIVYKESLLWKMQYLYPELDYTGFYNASSVMNFEGKDAETLQNLILEIESNIHAHSTYQLSLISTFLSKVLLLKDHIHQADCPQKPSPMMYKLLELINVNYNNWTGSRYAHELGLSENQLLYFIKKNAQGKSLLQIIHERKLSEAKKLLITTSRTVSEIAYQLEFNEPAHFTNWFKKLSGLSPTQFRHSS